MTTYELYKKAFDAVEEFLFQNDESWNSFQSGANVLDVYQLEKNDKVIAMLDQVIACNNANDIAYDFLKELEINEIGYFSDNSMRYKEYLKRKHWYK